jgi:uncharacterized membrane protein
MAGKLRVTLGWLTRHLRNKFLLGIIVIVPVAVTAWVLVWIFNSIDNILQPFIKSTWGANVPRNWLWYCYNTDLHRWNYCE